MEGLISLALEGSCTHCRNGWLEKRVNRDLVLYHWRLAGRFFCFSTEPRHSKQSSADSSSDRGVHWRRYGTHECGVRGKSTPFRQGTGRAGKSKEVLNRGTGYIVVPTQQCRSERSSGVAHANGLINCLPCVM